MRRGEIWTVSGVTDYARTPRPAVVVQREGFDLTDSVAVCAFTTDRREAPLFRIAVEPSELYGLRQPSSLMVDKVTGVSRTKVGARVGRLNDGDVRRPNEAPIVFLGLGVSPAHDRNLAAP